MTSPVSAIEAIEKAMEDVTNRVTWSVEGFDDATGQVNVVGDGFFIAGVIANQPDQEATAAYIAACNPVAMREVIALARQAEALQREIAEKDARIAALEAGMRPFSKFAGVVFERNFNSSDPVDTMTATDGAVSTLYARDFFSARALLGGENAGN